MLLWFVLHQNHYMKERGERDASENWRIQESFYTYIAAATVIEGRPKYHCHNFTFCYYHECISLSIPSSWIAQPSLSVSVRGCQVHNESIHIRSKIFVPVLNEEIPSRQNVPQSLVLKIVTWNLPMSRFSTHVLQNKRDSVAPHMSVVPFQSQR